MPARGVMVPRSALSRAHGRLMVRRAPGFVVVWLAVAGAWHTVLAAQGRTSAGVAAAALVAQAVIALGALQLVRAAPPGLVLPVLALAVTVLGWSTTAVFAGAGASRDVLAFVLLLLYLAAALFFAWGAAAGLVVIASTVVGWFAATPWLASQHPRIELATAVVFGAALAIALAENGRRAIAAAVAHRTGELRARRALAAAVQNERRARTDAEHSRSEAETASRARDELVAMVSHELRSPLHAVTTWTRLLREGRLEQPRVARILTAIEENCRLQSRLVEDLVDTARLASGGLALHREPLDVREVVERTAEQVRPAAEAKGVALVTRLGREPARLRADPQRLHQIVENLLSNALRHTSARDEIVTEVRAVPAGVEIVVRDTGTGIPPELLPVVFEPYTSGRREGAERLGMGLAIVRRLVELHGGSIDVESPAPHRGAVFRIRLPAAEDCDVVRTA